MPKKSAAHKSMKSSPSKSHGAQSQGKGKASGSAGGSWKKVSGPGMAGGNKTKDGCFPKLLTLLLPFIAIGAYFFLRS